MDFCGIFGGYVAEASISGMSWRAVFPPRILDRRVLRTSFPRPSRPRSSALIIGTVAVVSRVQHHAAGPKASAARPTRSVVLSSICIILVNVVLVKLIFFMYPGEGR